MKIYWQFVIILLLLFLLLISMWQNKPPQQKHTTVYSLPGISIKPDPSATLFANQHIMVMTPQPNDVVSLPFVISGKAQVFENQFNYRIKDAEGIILTQGNAITSHNDAGESGYFSITISSFSARQSIDKGIIELFDYSPKDGSEIDTVTIPIQFTN